MYEKVCECVEVCMLLRSAAHCGMFLGVFSKEWPGLCVGDVTYSVAAVNTSCDW